MWFHFIQVPLIGLIALAVYLLTDGLEGRAVMVSRCSIGVFAVSFSAYDAAAGIGTGYALRNAQGLSAGAQEAIYEAVKDMPVLSLIFGLSVVGAGRRSDGAAARRGVLDGRASLPGWHVCLGCFFLAAAWLEVAPGRLTSASRPFRR